MNNGLAARAFAAWTYLRRQLWTVQIFSCRCISLGKSGQVILPDTFLGQAEQLRLELLIYSPLLRRRLRTDLAIRIADAPAAGLPDAIVSDLRVRRVGHRVTRVIATLPRNSWVNRKSLQFEIHRRSSPRPLASICIPVLDTLAAQLRMLDNLQPTRLRLWLRNRTGSSLADTVAPSSGSLVPEFTLPASEFAAFIPPYDTHVALELVSPVGRLALHRQPIQIGRERFRFRGPALHLQNDQLFSQPGIYRLVARIGGREIAQFPFQFVGEADLLREIEIPRIQIRAQSRAGESLPSVTTLHWEEHSGFEASIEVKSRTAAPDTLVPCTACVRDGSLVLQREDIVFPLDRFSRRIRLQPVHFGGTGLQTRPKPLRLSLSVAIDGVEKACALVLVLPPERITNFEGQLTFEVNDLPFDELEYGHIVHRLGLQTQTNPRRGFWHWLQAKLS